MGSRRQNQSLVQCFSLASRADRHLLGSSHVWPDGLFCCPVLPLLTVARWHLNQKISLIILVIVGISLIPVPVFAERVISIEKTIPTESEKLVRVFSDLEAYPQILPKNIESSTILNEEENIARMTFRLEGIRHQNCKPKCAK